MAHSLYNRNIETSASEDIEIRKQKQIEVEKMVRRAKSSSRYHGINLRHGTPNPGLEDCAFEAIIQNNNDRSCFMTKYPLHLDNRYGKQDWVAFMSQPY